MKGCSCACHTEERRRIGAALEAMAVVGWRRAQAKVEALERELARLKSRQRPISFMERSQGGDQ